MREIKFNNKVLEVKALRVIIQPLSSIVDSSENIYGLNQQRFTKYIKEPKKIILSFPYENKSEKEINKELSTFFFSEEEVMLINPKDETTYFMAKLQGEINVNTEGSYSVVTLELFSYDGYLHAVNRDTFTAALNSDGIMEMIVNNEGTETTSLSFTADIKSDNGYLGVVTENGAMEFGKIDEVDGYIDMAETIYKNEMYPSEASQWTLNNGYINWKMSGNLENKMQGTFEWPGEYARVKTFGNTWTDNRWFGPSLSRAIPAKKSDGKRDGNFLHRFQLTHKYNIVGNNKKDARLLGRQEVNLSNGQNPVATFVIYDGSANSFQTIIEFWLFGIKMDKISVNKDFAELYGVIDILLVDNKITFKVYNIDTKKTLTKSYYDDRLISAQVTHTTYWVSKFKNYTICNTNYSYSMFQWIGTQEFVDVPNRYMDGDVLTYDGDSGKFYVNDVLTLGDIVQGSTDLKIPPGKHKIQFYYSDFNEVPPVIKGTIRKRWL